MKFKIKQSFLLGLVLVITSVILVSSLEEKSKRAESMMEYLNGFFSNSAAHVEKSNAENQVVNKNKLNNIGTHPKSMAGHHHKKKSHGGHKKHKAHFRFKERNHYMLGNASGNASGAAGGANSSAGNSTNSTGGGTSPILQEWFMISSPAFKDLAKFPVVNLPTGKKIIIDVDSEFFRLSCAFEKAQGEDKAPTNKFFWFRLSGLNIYYSLTKSDINILGAIAVTKISSVEISGHALSGTNTTYCFSVQDSEGTDWKLCALTEATSNAWVCAIKKILVIEDPKCTNPSNSTAAGNTTIIERNITQPLIIIPLPSRECNEGWNYQKNGADWECDCSEGREQAPIDLPDIKDAIDSPVKPLFQFEEISSASKDTTAEGQSTDSKQLKLVLKDNSLKIFHEKFGKVVTMDGAVYYAQEIIIHTPSEHTIKGKSFDMELQIVHYGQSVGDIAKQLILSFVFEKTPGVYNKFIDDLDIFNLPNPVSLERDLTGSIFIPKVLYSADDTDVVIMKPFSFYTYQGSLTMPPCTESTIMYVASKPIKLGSTAVQLFQEALRVPDIMTGKGDVIVSNWIPMSNRLVQPLNGRPVFHYNHENYCGPDPQKPDPAPKGHYEKVVKAVVNYFYVNNMDPSGIPNAFVVSEKEAIGKT